MHNLYTVESAAEKLGVHKRTILRWINQGELKASKVGRQWRIRMEDLNELVGEPEEKQPALCSSVLDLPVSGKEEADRYSNLVTAAFNSRGNIESEVNHRVDCIYNREEQKLRFIIWGSISFMKDFFTLMDRY